ncbi:MAG: DUF4178 domain-containing protein [Pyrinomonadaceae bacterium]
MASLEANCPACGAPVVFKSGSSIVVVCEYCRSVVARTDRALEDLGKVAEIVESGSPLDVGLKGTYQSVGFELTGRAQLGHQAGGMWDEWYAAFRDGRWGWLAEAQGRFYLTFRQPHAPQDSIQTFDNLELGQSFEPLSGAGAMVVAEKGTARYLAAKGEIPYRLSPDETYEYADLSGQGGLFATMDYSESPPLVFVGRELEFAELGFAGNIRAPERDARRTSAAQLSCPHCGGSLELHAPDTAERVTCPNCDSLLDVNEGQLKYLKSLEPGRFTPSIPLGTVGEIDGKKTAVIGFVARSVEIEGTRYFWEEYLLYNPATGFRWLVQSDNHWNFVQSVTVGDVTETKGAAQFRGESYKLFQDATAQVEYVAGEFYWKVTTGELVRAADYVHPPLMLSKEVSTAPEHDDAGVAPAGEINWSLAKYATPKEIERAFNLSNLPRPSSIAPNQPFPYTGFYKYWALLMALLFTVALASFVTGGSRSAFEQSYQLPPLANTEATQTVFSAPFELAARRNISVSAAAPVDNSWVYIEGDLINEETGLVQQFSLPVEYYHGYEDGESWSEGERNPRAVLSALPAGKYTMRLEAQWERWQQPISVNVHVDQNVSRPINFILALLGLSAIPVIILIYRIMFEKRRWADSSIES